MPPATERNLEASLVHLQQVLSRSPFSAFLGCSAREYNQEPVFQLAFAEHHIGNPLIRAIHGGIIASFCECAATAILALEFGEAELRKAVTQEVTYVRSATAGDCFALARIERTGRRLATVSVKAWQDDVERPVALSRINCLVSTAG